MKAVKIIIGIFLVLGALNNLISMGMMTKYEFVGYMMATLLFFIIGAFLLYSALKPRDVEFKLSDDDDR